MPVENTGQYPTRLLLFATLQLIGRHAGGQLFDQRVDPDQPVGNLFVGALSPGTGRGTFAPPATSSARSASSQSRSAAAALHSSLL